MSYREMVLVGVIPPVELEVVEDMEDAADGEEDILIMILIKPE